MYSNVYFRDESGDHYVKLGIKCENIPSITIEGNTVTLTYTGERSIREDNSTKDWGEFFELSFEKDKVMVEFKKHPKSLKIRPDARSYKVDFIILGLEGTRKEPLFSAPFGYLADCFYSLIN